jgi:hypothetical protein
MSMSNYSFNEGNYLRDIFSDSQVHRGRQNLEESRDVTVFL